MQPSIDDSTMEADFEVVGDPALPPRDACSPAEEDVSPANNTPAPLSNTIFYQQSAEAVGAVAVQLASMDMDSALDEVAEGLVNTRGARGVGSMASTGSETLVINNPVVAKPSPPLPPSQPGAKSKPPAIPHDDRRDRPRVTARRGTRIQEEIEPKAPTVNVDALGPEQQVYRDADAEWTVIQERTQSIPEFDPLLNRPAVVQAAKGPPLQRTPI